MIKNNYYNNKSEMNIPTPKKKRTCATKNRPAASHTLGRTYTKSIHQFLTKEVGTNVRGIYVVSTTFDPKYIKFGYGSKVMDRLDNYCTYLPRGSLKVMFIVTGIPLPKQFNFEKKLHENLKKEKHVSQLIPDCGKRKKESEWFHFEKGSVRNITMIIQEAIKKTTKQCNDSLISGTPKKINIVNCVTGRCSLI